MTKGLIVRRVLGTWLLIATVGLTSCQSLYHAAIGVFADTAVPSESQDA